MTIIVGLIDQDGRAYMGGETAVMRQNPLSGKAYALAKAIIHQQTAPLDEVGITLTPEELKAIYEAILQYHKENQLRGLTIEVDSIMGKPCGR